MKDLVVYRTAELLSMLSGFELQLICTIHEDEDDAVESYASYLVRRDIGVTAVRHYHSFGTSTTVHFKDSTSASLFADNVNPNEKSWLRINENGFLSPELRVTADHIEVTNPLKAWLKFNGISDDALEAIIERFPVYETIQYPGVPTPERHGKYWGYSSESLVLDEREIQTALDSIEDELLREKIKCVLYARVFKRRY